MFERDFSALKNNWMHAVAWYKKYGPRPKSVHDFKLLGIASCYACVCLFIASLSNSVAEKLNTNVGHLWSKDKLLPDPIMMRLNETGVLWNRKVADTFVQVAAVGIVVGLVLMKDNAVVVFRRLILVIATLYALRSLTVTLTVLPDPYPDCEPSKTELLEGTWRLLSGQRVACGDIFFSGHTIVYSACYFLWIRYYRAIWVTLFATVAVVVSMFSLIATRLHYTDDVLVSFVLYFAIWTLYHWSVDRAATSYMLAQKNPLHRVKWTYRLLHELDDPEYEMILTTGIHSV